jgi:hypothetical protein
MNADSPVHHDEKILEVIAIVAENFVETSNQKGKEGVAEAKVTKEKLHTRTGRGPSREFRGRRRSTRECA